MNESSIFGGGGGWLITFVLIILLFGGGNLFGGGAENVESVVNAAINNQTTQAGIRDVLLSSANNNLETLKFFSDQNMGLQAQNNSKTLAAINAFNELQRTMQAQGSETRSAIAQLGFQLDSCCCGIKTQLLQDKYDRLYEQYRSVQTDASNAAQSQYILGVMGKWVANPAATA